MARRFGGGKVPNSMRPAGARNTTFRARLEKRRTEAKVRQEAYKKLTVNEKLSKNVAWDKSHDNFPNLRASRALLVKGEVLSIAEAYARQAAKGNLKLLKSMQAA